MELYAMLVGGLSSLFTQMIKRENAGALENILLTAANAFGAVWLTVQMFGLHVDFSQSLVTSYAFHGITHAQLPMKAMRFAAIDYLLEGIGGAFSLASSRRKKNGKSEAGTSTTTASAEGTEQGN